MNLNVCVVKKLSVYQNECKNYVFFYCWIYSNKIYYLFFIFVLAFKINVNAVDVQVLTGNRDLPGAGSSIPANAYEIYSKGGQQQESTIVLEK